MTDTHAHLNSPEFNEDYAQAMGRSFENGLKAIINAGDNLATSEKAVNMAHDFENAYAAVGMHPSSASGEIFDQEKYRALAQDKKTVAIGETGLDYFRLTGDKQKAKDLQKEIFVRHIELAKELDLPLVLHCRGSQENPKDAYGDMLKILSGASLPCLGGVIHCFSSDWEIAEKFLGLGFYLGFTGIVTFPKSEKVLEVVKNAPIDKILAETDCPYLSPEPYRGQRNEPWRVKFVIAKIAEIRGMTFKEAEKAIDENARRLFGI